MHKSALMIDQRSELLLVLHTDNHSGVMFAQASKVTIQVKIYFPFSKAYNLTL